MDIDNRRNRLYDLLIEHGIATDKEISLVTSINGFIEDTLNSLLFSRTAYRDFNQYKEATNDNDD